MSKVGLILFPAFDWQISPTHPERSERLLYTKDQLLEEGIADIENIKFYNPLVASPKDIDRAHFVIPTQEGIVTDSHYISAGAAMKAADLIMNKEVDKVFSITRPPGHHAMEVVYGDRGFCVINNMAVMIEYLRSKKPDLKIAIVDTDCHHGDGTENIYYDDPNVLFISVHQDGSTLYPGTGFINEQGGPNGYGYNINIPLPPYTGDQGYLTVAETIIKPILADFKPEIIVQSAGQDNHYSDPLTNMNLTAKGYAKLTEIIDADILLLEGGYSIEGALPYLNLAIILAMAKLDYSNVIEPDLKRKHLSENPEVFNYINQIKPIILENWFNREANRTKLFKNKQIYLVKKRIYYDTSGIMENQNIIYHLCDKCLGIKERITESSNGFNGKTITITHNACKECLLLADKIINEKTSYKQYIMRK